MTRMITEKMEEEDCTALELAAAFLKLHMGEELEDIPVEKYEPRRRSRDGEGRFGDERGRGRRGRGERRDRGERNSREEGRNRSERSSRGERGSRKERGSREERRSRSEKSYISSIGKKEKDAARKKE